MIPESGSEGAPSGWTDKHRPPRNEVKSAHGPGSGASSGWTDEQRRARNEPEQRRREAGGSADEPASASEPTTQRDPQQTKTPGSGRASAINTANEPFSTTITGAAGAAGVRAEVFPGGALASLSLTRQAVALGSRELAAGILTAVEEATAVANQRTKAALRDALAGLDHRDLTLLGLNQDRALTERAESTTPDSWRVS